MKDDEETIKEAVSEHYAAFARAKASCCGGAISCSCSTPADPSAPELSAYGAEDLSAIPADADLGLGCGNPLALESIKPGETVLDLGSGGGIDCFIAARRTGPSGRVVGVDMTPEMIALARRNAGDAYPNVEFRLGEIEDLPVTDGEADLVISNCVINLVPDKTAAFAETFRALAPGGRLSVSDIVTSEPLPPAIARSISAYVACVGGANSLAEYLDAVRGAGFADVRVVADHAYCATEADARAWLDAMGIQLPAEVSEAEALRVAGLYHSVTVQAVKPA